MSEFEKLKIVAEYEFLKHLRRKRFYVVLAVTIIVQALVLVLLPALGEGYPKDVMQMATLLSIGPSLAAIGAIFFAGDAIAGEFERKTGYILLPTPVRRTTIVVGKYLACFSAMVPIVLISYAVVGASLLGIYHQIPLEVASSLGLCTLLVATIVGMTFFFSSVSKGAMGATAITLILFFVVFFVLESILLMTDQPRWFLLSYASDAVITVYGAYPFAGAMAEHAPPGATVPPEVGTSIAVMAAYLVFPLALSIWITKRREML